ncbi:zinc-binding dehydrogenase, partial [Photobacterium chitinilyticum]|uniref:alcohol dehydrogenase catalytic domain-containing protein n=1 Tax=Photobacterium chitinilyticum TaxID=2485123 RepID=UPI003D0D0A1E
MKYYNATEVNEFGGNDVLLSTKLSLKQPSNNEVCIKVTHCGVGFVDILMRKGSYPNLPPFPFIPGQDVVGHIYAKGSDVNTLEVGQRVIAHMSVGGYAEFSFVDQSNVIAVSDNTDGAELVSLPLNYVTAYQLLHRVAKVKDNATILVHGGAGGVGTAILELARINKIKVYATVSSKKQNAVIQRGAIPIDYNAVDFVSYLNEHCLGGVDAVFDPIGGDYWERSAQVLRKDGVLAGYGFSSLVSGDDSVTSNELPVIIGELNQLSHFGIKPIWYSISALKVTHPEWYLEDLIKLILLVDDKLIKPEVNSLFPLC